MQAIVCGLGGQGVITINALIGHLATYLGHSVTSAETHGMAMRGGSVYTSLKIGDDLCPTVSLSSADVIISTNIDEAKRNLCYLDEDGIVITDGEFTEDVPFKVISINARDIAIEQFGNAVHSGTILLGILMKEFSYLFPIDKSLEILSKNKKINIDALKYGLKVES